MNAHKAIERAKKGHERRFGQSMLPLKATVCSPKFVPCLGHSNGKQFVRIVDFETGSITDWTFQGKKIVRIGERFPTK